MRRRVPFSLFFFTEFLFFNFLSSAQDIHFNLVNPSKDDPFVRIMAMTQDAQGYLWLQRPMVYINMMDINTVLIIINP